MRRDRARPTALRLAVVLLLVASACGTRLSDEAFEGDDREGGGRAVQTDSGEELVPSGEAAVGATDTGPTESGTGTEGATGPVTGPAGAPAPVSGGAVTGGGAAPATTIARATGGQQTAAAGAGNTASDVGVTPNSILVGTITSISGSLGPEALTPPSHGARVYFQWLNENHGGINGRKVSFVVCDDKENPEQNKICAQKLIDQQKIFSMVAYSTLGFAAAKFTWERGVPEVGGEPIGNAYYKYPNLFSILPIEYKRDGKTIGDGGKLWAQTGTYRWFKQKLGVTKAAVFFYIIPISQTAGYFVEDGLQREGIETVYEGGGSHQGMNPAAPAYDADVIQMRNRGVDGIWNLIDIAGFQKLCQAMDRYAFTVKANVSTVQGWSQKVGADFSSPCRNSIFVTGETRSYAETNHPGVAEFRAAAQKYDPNYKVHQWMLEGWMAGKLFTEAVKSMGATPTRKGLMNWLNTLDEYTMDGMHNGLDYKPGGPYDKPAPDTFTIAQWQDSAKTFVTRAPMGSSFTTGYYFYVPRDDGS